MALGKWRIRVQKGHPKTPGMDFFFTVPRSHFLGPALIWPGHLGEHVLSLLGFYPSSLSVGFVSPSGKASLVSISAAILFIRSWHVYLPLELEKVVLKGSMAAKRASRVSYLLYYYCI